MTDGERPIAEMRKDGLSWEEIGQRLGKRPTRSASRSTAPPAASCWRWGWRARTMIEPGRGGRVDGDPLDAELEGLLGDLIRDWQAGTPRPLRAYLDGHPSLMGRPEVLIELINQEVVLRQMRDEVPYPADYLAEFPELGESLERLFEVQLRRAPAPRMGPKTTGSPWCWIGPSPHVG